MDAWTWGSIQRAAITDILTLSKYFWLLWHLVITLIEFLFQHLFLRRDAFWGVVVDHLYSNLLFWFIVLNLLLGLCLRGFCNVILWVITVLLFLWSGSNFSCLHISILAQPLLISCRSARGWGLVSFSKVEVYQVHLSTVYHFIKLTLELCRFCSIYCKWISLFQRLQIFLCSYDHCNWS